MKIIYSSLIIVIITLGIYNYFSSYRSAFEADQACHFIKSDSYQGSSNYGCDHDLETKQWILYKNEPDGRAASVIQRFRY